MSKKSNWQIKSIVGAYLVLVIFAVIWILPLIIAVVKSFTINGLGNYEYVLSYEKINYFHVIFNSMTIAISSALVVTLITALAAYAFSKMKFPGSKILYGAILACLAVPVAAVTSPLFATIKNMGFLDHHLGVIIPLIAFNSPMMLLMIKNYFDTIPDELLESARIDGASRFRIWYVFMVPLSVPIIANVLVLTFIYSWNDYLVPLLVMRSEENYPVTLAAQYFMSSTYQSPEDVARIYAVMILLALPSILVYLVSQKFLVAGATAGAVKG
ncbi:carbohydrate ABC transporter permease [uncultured Merdimonas sp.]|uniref:carbohydrate ABC transporter permease n=1 Tax=uncultured Merdimonas sp. TaxID=2023269 RepID=UPI0032078B22